MTKYGLIRTVSRTGDGVEQALTVVPGLRWILCPVIVESLARAVAALGASVTHYSQYGIERRIRGLLLSAKYRATGLRIDRWIQIESPRDVVLGNGVTLYGGSHYVAGRTGRIVIGDNTHVGRNCVLSGLGGIRIGAGCAISSSVCIYSVSNHFRGDPLQPILDCSEHRPVMIGDDVWIGAGAKILPGVEIGDHAVIGAGAVVHRAVPSWKVAVGVPAKIIKDRRDAVASPSGTHCSEAA